jgi:rod shape-determining protein MreB
MVVDIGGGTTEVGVISLGGMVYKGSVRVGGDKFDEGHHQLHPPQLRHADRRNHRRGHQEGTSVRAFPGSEVKEMEVKGRNLSEGMPRSFTISSNEILEALTEPLNQIVSAVKIAWSRPRPSWAPTSPSAA